MTRFLRLFEEWEVADHAAARAECCLGRTLGAYCEGRGPAPSIPSVQEARRLRLAAVAHLRALRALAEEARRNARVL